MAKRRKIRTKKSDDDLFKSRSQLRKEFPEDLVKAFIAVSKSGWSEKEYKRYRKLADKYLGKNANDKLISGRLVVRLAKATADVIYNKQEIKSCPTHPKYMGLRRPRNGCQTCMELYNVKKTSKEKKKEKDEAKSSKKLDSSVRQVSKSRRNKRQKKRKVQKTVSKKSRKR